MNARLSGNTNLNADFHKCRFDSIQTLRGLAAVFVILEHIRFLNCGAFGVDIFFCISGFMIMFTTHESTRHFLRKRIIRILPLYYLMTIGTFLLLLLFPSMFEQTSANPVFLIKSLLFIPFDMGGGILQPLMRIGWTVNCEMFFYLLFFLSCHISHKYRGLICSLLLALPVLLNSVLSVSFAPLNFYGNPVMLEFILGMICYYAAGGIFHLREKKQFPPFTGLLSLFGALVLFASLVITKPSINILGFRRFFLWGIPAMCIVLCFFFAGMFREMPKWSVKLGDMSFSVYLIHYYPVMFLDRMVFDFSAPSPFAVFGAVLTVLLCLLFAWVSWLLVEKHFTGWLKKIFSC